MKKVRPLLLLGLVLGGVYLLANTGKLSLINGAGWNKKSFILEYTAFYTGCQHEERREERHAPQNRAALLERLTGEGWVITTSPPGGWPWPRTWPSSAGTARSRSLSGLRE